MPRSALLVPGGGYSVERPLFSFVEMALVRRGVDVHGIAWTPPPLGLAEALEFVREEVTAALRSIDGPPLLVGKSLGTLAAPLAAERDLPAIWLTPLLQHPELTRAMSVATAPCLLVGGTADGSWNAAAAATASPHVLEVEGADHGMYLPGAVEDSIRAHGVVLRAVEGFLDTVVWP